MVSDTPVLELALKNSSKYHSVASISFFQALVPRQRIHQAVFEMLLKVMCVWIHIKGDVRAGSVSLKSEYW